jgi:peptide/nickel transport system permease protein
MAQRRESLPSETLDRTAGQTGQAGAGTLAATEAEQEADRFSRTRVSSPGRDAWRRFRHNWAALISLTVILLVVFFAIFAPWLHTTDPNNFDFTAIHAAPSAHHWFGTDELGRDEYSRLLFGLRIPLIVSIIGTVITVALGMLLGVTAGYFGGRTDTLLARFTDIMFAFPGFTLALIIISLYGKTLDNAPGLQGTGRLVVLIIVFGIVGWPALMRLVRSMSLSLVESQFVEAARTVGSSHWSILRRHLLPNMYGVILVQSAFIVVGFIYTEAVLSLFGLGVQPPTPDLGQMLINGSGSMGQNDSEVVFPAVMLTLLILAFTFLGDGIRDAVDPRSKG